MGPGSDRQVNELSVIVLRNLQNARDSLSSRFLLLSSLHAYILHSFLLVLLTIRHCRASLFALPFFIVSSIPSNPFFYFFLSLRCLSLSELLAKLRLSHFSTRKYGFLITFAKRWFAFPAGFGLVCDCQPKLFAGRELARRQIPGLFQLSRRYRPDQWLRQLRRPEQR